jgi:hypothetical protein
MLGSCSMSPSTCLTDAYRRLHTPMSSLRSGQHTCLVRCQHTCCSGFGALQNWRITVGYVQAQLATRQNSRQHNSSPSKLLLLPRLQHTHVAASPTRGAHACKLTSPLSSTRDHLVHMAAHTHPTTLLKQTTHSSVTAVTQPVAAPAHTSSL